MVTSSFGECNMCEMGRSLDWSDSKANLEAENSLVCRCNGGVGSIFSGTASETLLRAFASKASDPGENGGVGANTSGDIMR